MAQKYEIYKVISTGKKGHAQIVVLFNGQSVTRHIINNVGRHPDDTIPALHNRLRENIENNKKLTTDKAAAINILTDEKLRPKNIKPAQAVALVASMAIEIGKLKDELPMLEEALRTVQKEDPLMVNYF